MYGQQCVLPIKLGAWTWAALQWDKVRTTPELLAIRARQLKRRTEDIKIAIENVKQSRLQGKQRFDTKMRNRPKNATIEVGTKVLVHQTKLDKQYTDKLANRWIGPYIVDKILEGKVYVLKELDGTVAKWTISGNRLKKFYEQGYEVKEGAWDEY
jgi:hypothetical protein